MTLGDDSEHVELSAVEVQAPVPGHTSGGDVRVVAHVRAGAFAGAVDAWILRETWTAFCLRLTALEQTRQGSATLESMSPGELRLCIRSTDALDHMAVEGELTHHSYGTGAHQPGVLHLRFGPVEFDPTVLPKLVAELTGAVTALRQGAG